MALGGAWKQSLQRWLSDGADDAVLRWLFRGLVAATVVVVAFDYSDLDAALSQRNGQPAATPGSQPLPATRRSGDNVKPGPVRVPSAELGSKMTFELAADGRLVATGTITPGMAKTFADEIAKRGSYVKTVVLQSPGGSVQDALAMGRLIREKRYATEVVSGSYCASSCPLVFAGGVQRIAGAKAAIGVHQVYAFDAAASGGMAGAQHVSAQCQIYLRDMGVDLGVWVHAMETPKEELYYFKTEELLSLKLATHAEGVRPTARKG